MNNEEKGHLVDIIIPTWNNISQALQCVNSIIAHTICLSNIRIIIVNNGAPESMEFMSKHPCITVLEAGKNLGWEGGLKLGLEYSKTPWVMFMNDDTNVTYASNLWINRMVNQFRNPKVAAVGPMSNVVSGRQNIFNDQSTGFHSPEATFLIGFCMMLDRKKLDEVGGVDDTLPGGDDFDLAIRFRQAGYKLIIDRNVFVYHHGFQSGIRLRGGSDKPGGWNSVEMTDKTNHALIRKHGFNNWIGTHYGFAKTDSESIKKLNETEIVQKHVVGDDVLELGCGSVKTVERAIGVDIAPRGESTKVLSQISCADIVADLQGNLIEVTGQYDTIIGRHILEHMIDPIRALAVWTTKLKDHGRLILVCPDELKTQTIPLDPTHFHAFTSDSLDTIAQTVGLKRIAFEDSDISFCSVYQKNGHVQSI